MADMTAKVVLSAVDRMSAPVAAACKKAEGSLGGLAGALKAGAEASAEANAKWAQLGQAGTAMAVTGAGMLGSLVAATKASANYAEEIMTTSQQTGIAAEAWSRLKFAAEQSNVQVDTLRAGLFRMGKAAASNSEAFAALGISVRDSSGNLKGTEQLFGEVADKLRAIPSEGERGAIAMQLFGRSGRMLLPLLMEGSDGIRKFGDEAERLGIVLDEKAAKAGDDFNDNVDKLKKSVLGLTLQLGQALMPTIQAMVQWITGAVSAWRSWTTEHPLLNKAIIVTVTVIGSLLLICGTLLKTFSMMQGALAFLQGAQGFLGLSKAVTTATTATTGATAASGALSGGLLASLGPIALVAAALAGLGLEIWAAVNAYKAMKQAQDEAVDSADRLAAKEDELQRVGFESQRQTAVRLFGEEGGRKYDKGELSAEQNAAVRQEQQRLRASGKQKVAVRGMKALNEQRDRAAQAGGQMPAYAGAGAAGGYQRVDVNVSASPEFAVQYSGAAQREIRKGKRR